MTSIFEKMRLRPSQLRTVAERRFDDAQALRKTRQNARANGAMYLGGFVIECLLKASLLERFPSLQGNHPKGSLSRKEERLWSLCHRSHELTEILTHLPHVMRKMERAEPRERFRLTASLQWICSHWTIHARYSTQTATITDADDFLQMVQELKQWLR
jgi:hypothetical protein